MPEDYQPRIPQFDGTGPISAHQHVDRMNDSFDLQELDKESVKIRLFSQSLIGQVRKWFKELPVDSINDFPGFHQTFLTRWEIKKNPLHILSEYEIIRRGPGESVKDYCTRFNSVYNTILANIKPPQGLSLIKFLDGFEVDWLTSLGKEIHPH